MANKTARKEHVAVSFQIPIILHSELTRFAKSRAQSLADFLRQAGLKEMERYQNQKPAA